MSDYYDRAGEPISMEDWCRMFEDMEYKRIALTKVPGGEVSTVWLGLNHSFHGGPPLIFESMSFMEGRQNMDQRRYTTEESARRGHQEMVDEITARSVTKKARGQ